MHHTKWTLAGATCPRSHPCCNSLVKEHSGTWRGSLHVFFNISPVPSIEKNFQEKQKQSNTKDCVIRGFPGGQNLLDLWTYIRGGLGQELALLVIGAKSQVLWASRAGHAPPPPPEQTDGTCLPSTLVHLGHQRTE